MINTRPFPRKPWEPQPDNPSPRLSPVQRTKAMTVCIAAICTWCGDDVAVDVDEGLFVRELCEPQPCIIGISDRMVSIEDFAQYELSQPKFAKIINSAMVLLAGSVNLTAEILRKTCSFYKNYIDIIPIERIAETYGSYLSNYLDDRKNNIVRRRTGLTFKEFMTQAEWSEKDRDSITKEIKQIPDTGAIVTGIDETGAHIYLIDAEGVVSCQDSIGYAVVGTGDYHAVSQLMRNRHSPDKPYIDTLLLSYMAKRDAELNEYVGKTTDIFIIKDDKTCDELYEEKVKAIGDIYDDIYGKAFAEAKTKISAYLKDKK